MTQFVKGIGFHILLLNNGCEINEKRYLKHKAEMDEFMDDLKKENPELKKARARFYEKY